jgi:hypothetical protein
MLALVVAVCTPVFIHRRDFDASYERFNKGSYSTLDHGNIIAKCWDNGTVYLYDPKITEIARSFV